MKRLCTIMAALVLVYACSDKASSETVRNGNTAVLKEFVTASNQNNKASLTNILADGFSYNHEMGGRMEGKSDYINRVEHNFTTRDKSISIIDSKFESDSVITTHERIVTVMDTVLDINPREIETRRYTFRNGKVSNITHIDFVNITDYKTAFELKMIPFALWSQKAHPGLKEDEIKDNIKTLLEEYLDTAAAARP